MAIYEPVAITIGRSFAYSAVASFGAFALQILHEPGLHVGRDILVAAVVGAGTAGLHAAEATLKAWRAKKP